MSDVGSGVDTTLIAQMAFKPGEPARLYVARSNGTIVRYDYATGTGQLSNALTLATGLGQALGLAFHGDDLYVGMDNGAGDGRITRLSDPDPDGVYQTRHDFVHSIPIGQHDVNQLQIAGDTLYVGIGAVGRTGDPDEENVHTMTIARVADLTQIDFSGPIDSDFKGPVNHLADETEWLNTAASDGLLRYYASGVRNPFGLALDADGDLWVSTNGNSDVGFLSPDEIYEKLQPGAMGTFPPDSFGFGPPHVSGTPVAPFADLGQNPAVTGMDFVSSGPDFGDLVAAQFGASDQGAWPVGKDVLIVDRDTGAFEILIDEMGGPTDVVQDPFGRLLIADYLDGSVWLLESPPLPPAGRVPDGMGVPGFPLTLARGTDDDIVLTWSPSCAAGDTDYEVYEGTVGSFYSHAALFCSTGGSTTWTLTPSPGDRYYIVVPANDGAEGSYGVDDQGQQRPGGENRCLPPAAAACP